MWNVNNTFKKDTNHCRNILIARVIASFVWHMVLKDCFAKTGRRLFRILRTVGKGGDSTLISAPLRCERSSNHIEEEDKRLLPVRRGNSGEGEPQTETAGTAEHCALRMLK